ncbi:hypothetical protein ABFY57_24640 [Paenibacillus polymyxa]|uniref:hypothetical protein n=1 Tax=Paenibacillus polymyxa TaxID=1406 RepID=UPI003D2C2EE4
MAKLHCAIAPSVRFLAVIFVSLSHNVVVSTNPEGLKEHSDWVASPLSLAGLSA